MVSTTGALVGLALVTAYAMCIAVYYLVLAQVRREVRGLVSEAKGEVVNDLKRYADERFAAVQQQASASVEATVDQKVQEARANVLAAVDGRLKEAHGAVGAHVQEAMANAMKAGKAEIEEAQVTLQALRTERMKAVSTFRSVKEREHPDESDDETMGDDSPFLQFLRNVGQGAGVDVDAALNGDPGESAKAEALVKRFLGNAPEPAPDAGDAGKGSGYWL